MPNTENEVEALVELIRPWTLCDDGHGFDHGSERAARAVLAAGYRRVAPSVSCGCPVSGFGYRHHRHPCSRAGENEYVIPPRTGDKKGVTTLPNTATT